MGSYMLQFYARQLLLHGPWLIIAAAAAMGFMRSRRWPNLVQCAGAAMLLGTFLADWLLTDPNFGLLHTSGYSLRSAWMWFSLAVQVLGFLVFIGGYCWDKLTATRPTQTGFAVTDTYARTAR